MRFLPVNLNALMVELDDLDETLALLGALKRDPIPGIEELVPAARTILVSYRPTLQSFASLVDAIAGREAGTAADRASTLVTIPVRYDGEDLAEVARILGISPEEVVRWHTGGEYTVAFTGFAPGFAYLTGGHPGLDVPRRTTPRTRIPAGSVGLAGTFSGVYPQASPGGWQIIGTTPVAMWDIVRDVPALLQPGFRVRFVADDAAICIPAATNAVPSSSPPSPSAENAVIEVVTSGLQTIFQDLGRHGHAGQGVSASGAMDQRSLKAANRIVGNASNAACLESVNGGLQFRSRGNIVVAVTGADVPLTLTTADRSSLLMRRYQPLALVDGDTLTIGAPAAGTYCYVAVRGGFVAQPVLGSCSTDTLAHVGPPALVAGDVLGVRPVRRGAIVGTLEEMHTDLPCADEDVVLDIVLGPRTDWFTPDAIALLREQRWCVTPQSNRVGLRLAGETPLSRVIELELPSEGTALGAIQVPPSGQPVLFLADHPLTGGYPVIGSVAPHHMDRAGQIPVNAWIRFNPICEFNPVACNVADAAKRA